MLERQVKLLSDGIAGENHNSCAKQIFGMTLTCIGINVKYNSGDRYAPKQALADLLQDLKVHVGPDKKRVSWPLLWQWQRWQGAETDASTFPYICQLSTRDNPKDCWERAVTACKSWVEQWEGVDRPYMGNGTPGYPLESTCCHQYLIWSMQMRFFFCDAFMEETSFWDLNSIRFVLLNHRLRTWQANYFLL